MSVPAPVLPAAPLAALEAEITELWGHLNAASYRFLELIAEFDRARDWGYHGCASCVQWLNWQCGIGPVAAREKLRVARALAELPKISEAFRQGRISYSKVRAMTRIATPAMEDTLLTIALHGTGAGRRDEAFEPRHALRLPSPARARGRLFGVRERRRSVRLQPARRVAARGVGGRERFRGIALPASNAARGLEIDADTSQSLWLGEPLDYSLAIEALYLERFGTG